MSTLRELADRMFKPGQEDEELVNVQIVFIHVRTEEIRWLSLDDAGKLGATEHEKSAHVYPTIEKEDLATIVQFAITSMCEYSFTPIRVRKH